MFPRTSTSKLAAAALVTLLSTAAFVPAQSIGPYGGSAALKFARYGRGKITSIEVHHSPSQVINMAITTAAGSSLHFGTGRAPKVSTFSIPASEHLTAVRIWYDKVISGMELRTSGGRLTFFGQKKGSTIELSRAGHQVIGFHGTADAQGIASLGVWLTAAPPIAVGPHGSLNGTKFAKMLGYGTTWRALAVYHNLNRDGILNMNMLFTYKGKSYGTGLFTKTTTGGTWSYLTMGKGEYLAEVKLWYQNKFRITGMLAKTSKGRTMGFGRPDNRLSTVILGRANHEIVGFHGLLKDFGTTGQQRVESLGCYLRPNATAKFSPFGKGCAGTGRLTSTQPAGESHNLTNLSQSANGANGAWNATGGFRGPAKITQVKVRTAGRGSLTVAIYKAGSAFKPLGTALATKTIQTGVAQQVYSIDMPLTLPAGNYVLAHQVFAGTKQPIATSGGKKVWHFSLAKGAQNWTGPFYSSAWKFEVVGTRTISEPIPQLTSTMPRLNTKVTLTVTGARANAPAGMISGFTSSQPVALTSLGRPDCMLLTSLDSIAFGSTDAMGRFTVNYDLPAIPLLQGVKFYNQAFFTKKAGEFVLDAVSNGGASEIGR